MADSKMIFVIPMKPVAWGRARRCGSRYFNSDRHEDAMEELRWVFLAGRRSEKPLSCAVSMKILFCYQKKPVRGVTKHGTEWKTSRPDLDNLLKLVWDAMSGILIDDDEQICEVYAAKRFHAEADEIRIEMDVLDAEKK